MTNKAAMTPTPAEPLRDMDVAGKRPLAPQELRQKEEARTTLVFDFNIRTFPHNPFHVSTPFGPPAVVAVGDICDERDRLEEINTALLDACRDVESKIVDFVAGRINWRPDDFLYRVRAALLLAEGQPRSGHSPSSSSPPREGE